MKFILVLLVVTSMMRLLLPGSVITLINVLENLGSFCVRSGKERVRKRRLLGA